MKLFTIQNNTPHIRPEALIITEFKDIWDRDTSEGKHTAIIELAYVYFLEAFDSVYDQYDDKAKPIKIIEDLISTKTKRKAFNHKDPLIIEARSKYNSLQTTPTLQFYNSLNKALEKARQTIDRLEFKDDSDGKKLNTFFKNVAEYEKTIHSINRIKETIKKEMTNAENLRGGSELNPWEVHPDER